MDRNNVLGQLDRFQARDQSSTPARTSAVGGEVLSKPGLGQVRFFASQMRRGIFHDDPEAELHAREVRGGLITLLAAEQVPTPVYRTLDRHLNDTFIGLNQRDKAAALVAADLFLEALEAVL